VQGEEWGGLYEDDLALQEPEEEPQESDSDFEFDGTRIKKTKSKKFAKAKAAKQAAVPSTKVNICHLRISSGKLNKIVCNDRNLPYKLIQNKTFKVSNRNLEIRQK
jgi:hypothetical protein